jgi:hypothetical protein
MKCPECHQKMIRTNSPVYTHICRNKKCIVLGYLRNQNGTRSELITYTGGYKD